MAADASARLSNPPRRAITPASAATAWDCSGVIPAATRANSSSPCRESTEAIDSVL